MAIRMMAVPEVLPEEHERDSAAPATGMSGNASSRQSSSTSRFLASTSASQTTSATFASSDGCMFTEPTVIQLRFPPLLDAERRGDHEELQPDGGDHGDTGPLAPEDRGHPRTPAA